MNSDGLKTDGFCEAMNLAKEKISDARLLLSQVLSATELLGADVQQIKDTIDDIAWPRLK